MKKIKFSFFCYSLYFVHDYSTQGEAIQFFMMCVSMFVCVYLCICVHSCCLRMVTRKIERNKT